MVMEIHSKDNPLYGCYDAHDDSGGVLLSYIALRAINNHCMGCNANLN